MIAALAGCDRAWQAYEQIELGRPLPADGLPENMIPANKGNYAWHEDTVLLIPAITAGNGVVAIVEDGVVVSKVYSSSGFGFWLLCQSIAKRWVMEIEVPEHLYVSPPVEGLVEQWGYNYYRLTPTNALEYLIRNFEEHSTASRDARRPGKDEQMRWSFVSYEAGMFSYEKDPPPEKLWNQTASLVGMTQEGFDWTYHDPFGGTLRVQNLGHRRFRLESKYFGLFDPLMLLGRLQYKRVYGDDETTRINSSEQLSP